MSEDFEIPQDLEIPNFANKEEENEWRFEMIAKTCTNLAQRVGRMEQLLSRGADMIQYKIPCDTDYSNLTQLFDNLFERLNKIEEKLSSD